VALVLVLMFGAPAFAQLTPAVDPAALQPGAIAGTVQHAFSGRPVWGATVQLAGRAGSLATDANGRFEFRPVPPGTYVLTVTDSRLVSLRIIDIVVRPGETTDLRRIDAQLAPFDDGVQPLEELVVNASLLAFGSVGGGADEPVQLAQMVVTPSRFGIGSERGPASFTLTRRELANLPQLGEDLYRTIGRLPGLAADDLSSGFWLRGAPNDEVLARLDGVDLIEPFHLKDFGGVLSIVDLETIRSIDLITGGFTAEYGNRLAGVLTIETQQVPRGHPRTTLGVSVTNVRATRQGEFARGDGQWMLAARRGYLDLALRLSRSDVDLSPEYYDVSGKLVRRLGPQHTLSFHFLYAGDRLHNDEEKNVVHFHSTTVSGYAWTRWQGAFGDRLTGEAVLSFAHLEWDRGGSAVFYGSNPMTLSDRRRLDVGTLRQDWTLGLTDAALLRAGFDTETSDARYRYFRTYAPFTAKDGQWVRDPQDAAQVLSPDDRSTGAYAALRLQPVRPLVIEPALRFEHHDYTHESGWCPRFNASLELTPRTVLRAAWGRYRQAPGLQELSVGDGETSFSDSKRASQCVVGVSHQLTSGVNLRVEAYERDTTHLRPRFVNPIDPIDVFHEVRYDRTVVAPRRGRARGVEFIAEHRGGTRLGWSVSYALSRAEEQIGSRWAPVDRDQTHTFYTDLSYSPARNWQLGLSWQYHTGWPTTDLTYRYVPLDNGSAWLAEVGPYNALRLGPYHRLDLRATRRFQLQHGELRVYVDIFNAYNRYNESGINYQASVSGQTLTMHRSSEHMIPILPTAGISWEF
jgi:outer membrane cobalamin receptor